MSFIVNEVLCYLSFSFKRVNRSLLVSTLSSFYHEDELSEAKLHLCIAASTHTPVIDGWAKLLNNKGLPTNRKGNDGQHKCELEAYDVLSIFALLDVNQVPMPTFVARPSKLDRVPSLILSSSFNMDTADVVATSLDSMLSTLGEVLRRLEKIEKHLGNSSQPQVRSSPSLYDSGATSSFLGMVSQGPLAQGPSSRPPASVSWADQASKLAASNTDFILPVSKASVSSKPVIQGRHQAVGCGIKTIQRQLTCFVGRLDKSTSEEELHDYLESVGIRDATCKNLEPKNGRVFGTAAFRVSCKAEFKDLFYKEDNWPEVAELRDWISYNKDDKLWVVEVYQNWLKNEVNNVHILLKNNVLWKIISFAIFTVTIIKLTHDNSK